MISKYFFLLMSIIFFSCNHSKEKVINNFDTTVKALQSLPDSSLTKITIEPAVYFFDSLEKGSEVMGRFLIKNIGTKNFRIRQVVSGCDCTIPSYSKNEILPNDSIWINFKLNSSEFNLGYNQRILNIYGNFYPYFRSLKIEGYI